MQALQAMAKAARDGQPFKPVQLSGGATQGRLLAPTQAPEKKNETVVRKQKGKGYAWKFLNESDDEEEDEEELQRRFQDQMCVKPHQSAKKRLTTVDDATSLATHDPITAGEELNAVYKSYKFCDTKPDATKNLLIHEFKDEILQQIDTNNVVIIKGPTGCGKTTQVPLFILDEARERNIYCNIIVTQPRRIAATTIAQRICEQRGWTLGTLVGYQIALERKTHKSDTRLTFVTAGVLLQKLVSRQLEEYTHIIVDEVHERENETDFMLIILKRLIKMRGNRKKLILMSATMTTTSFTDYFTRRGPDGRHIVPPVIDLPHEKPYPVDYYYLDSLPLLKPDQVVLDLSQPSISSSLYHFVVALLSAFKKLDQQERPFTIGAVLIFLPGIVEIDTMYKILNENTNCEEKWFICPLHSSISFEEQMKAFSIPPTGKRKVILATNIAESSITVPDVKYVIDFCLTKRQVQDQNTFYSSLHLCWESKSQAEQRAGRAGRTQRGSVHRLVYRAFYDVFEEHSPPEILRCPLDRLVLKAKQLDMGPPAEILGRAMDPPDLTNIERTILNLKELGALSLTSMGEYDEQDGDLTFTGQVMAELPLDTQLSKLILVGHMFSVLRECVTMACCMSGRNIFASPLSKRMETYNAKMGWEGGSKSDPLTALSLYDHWKKRKSEGKFHRSGGESEQQWANRNFAQLKSLREVEKLEIEVLNRLEKLQIVDTRASKIKNNKEVVPLVLKVCLAGACYPNFFLHNHIDEEEAVKTLGKRDPCRTVYLRNFPQDQPGPLYRDVIKGLLEGCGSGLKVQFDGSSKVYVEFESSLIPHGGEDKAIENDVPVPGRVMKAVYRAVKMRHLDIPMKIPLYKAPEARHIAKKIFGDHLYPNSYCYELKKNADGTKAEYKPSTCMPGLNQTFVSLTVTHVIDPSNFYVVLENQLKNITWIRSSINNGSDGTLVDLNPQEIIPGMPCLSLYTDQNTEWYRAKIVAVSQEGVKVYYVDYGNYENVTDPRCLKGYGPRLLDERVHEEAPVALRCRLAEVHQLSDSDNAQWSKNAVDDFKKSCHHYTCDAKIYSVVNDTMAVILYPSKHRPKGFALPLEESLNYLLVKKGHARFVEEPYLSKENHERREEIANRKEGFVIGPNTDDHQATIDAIKFESPILGDARQWRLHQLIGPISPLEMKAYPITRKCAGKTVTVDWNSINSVLINENPVDTTSRLIVAGTVSQSQHNPALTLRNTTLMPAIRGMSGILALLFAPKTELRVDPEITHYTGALCGLGCDENGLSYDQENDVEITFDCKFGIDDIEKINKLRFWMERVLCRSPDHQDHAAMGPGVMEVQEKCVRYLIELFSEDRAPLSTTYFANKHEWNQIPEECLVCPTNSDAKVYKLIWGVELKTPAREQEVAQITRHLAKINMYVNGSEPMKQPITCMLCQHYADNVRSLDFHVKTQVHRIRVDQFFDRPYEKADMCEVVDQYHRRIRSLRQKVVH